MTQADTKFLTKIFYGLIWLASSLALSILLYLSLSLDSSISSLIFNVAGSPFYFWTYILLTLGAIFLFGTNVTLLVYQWRKYGLPKIRKQTFTGVGSLIGIGASACPICGSTLLSAIGIVGGLASFPLGGLELKALSFGLVLLPVLLTLKELKRLKLCNDATCPAPRDASFEDKDGSWFVALVVIVASLLFVSWDMLKSEPVFAKLVVSTSPPHDEGAPINDELFNEVAEKVLPKQGFQSKISLSDSVVQLVSYGVIDPEKFKGQEEVLTKPTDKKILLTRENAHYHVNLLWPLGLANYMSSNKSSPVNGKSLFNFASTGGWTLGKEKNGGAYFNKFKIVELTPEQESLVTKIAKNTYRPCCNNSTFFQDCNHGSALLGLLQLGVSQGLSEDELYREALTFNSFWFPDNYLQTALYFKVTKNIEWENVSPQEVMGKDFSSISGWSKNIHEKIKQLGILPQKEGGASCGV